MHQSPFSPFVSATEVLDIVLSIKTDMALSNRGNLLRSVSVLEIANGSCYECGFRVRMSPRGRGIGKPRREGGSKVGGLRRSTKWEAP